MKTLKELRQKKKISQVEMSILLGTSLQNYREYERGARMKMPEKYELKLKDILNCDYQYNREREAIGR